MHIEEHGVPDMRREYNKTQKQNEVWSPIAVSDKVAHQGKPVTE